MEARRGVRTYSLKRTQFVSAAEDVELIKLHRFAIFQMEQRLI